MATQIQLGLLANDSVNAPAIKNQEVTSDDIASNAVIGDKIASNAVTASKLSNAAVTSEKLQSSTNNNNERAVGTDHIKDGSITAEKLSPNLEYFPAGGIIMWYGSSSYQPVVINGVTYQGIPSGWVLCDGNAAGNGALINGIKIPDLRNKFIVGASDNTGTGVVFDATNGTTSGSYGINNTGGEVAHKLSVPEMPAHDHDIYGGYGAIPDWFGGSPAEYGMLPAGSANAPQYTQYDGYLQTVGSSYYHENRPPYYALAYIIKVTSPAYATASSAFSFLAGAGNIAQLLSAETSARVIHQEGTFTTTNLKKEITITKAENKVLILVTQPVVGGINSQQQSSGIRLVKKGGGGVYTELIRQGSFQYLLGNAISGTFPNCITYLDTPGVGTWTYETEGFQCYSNSAFNGNAKSQIILQEIETTPPPAPAPLVPIGSIFHFASNKAPTGFLVCDGSIIPNKVETVQGITADFSSLNAIVGDAYRKPDDLTGVRRIPDLRGEFIRGWSGSRTDADSGRSFGSFQADAFASHHHTWNFYDGGWNTGYSKNTCVAANLGTIDRNTSDVGGTETRPRNVALLPCIKY